MPEPDYNNNKPLLILDLDEALVHTLYEPLGTREPDHRFSEFYVYKRPYVDQFLTRMWKHYNIAVWSVGGSGYVEPTVAWLMKDHPQPLFVWSFLRCTRRYDIEKGEEYRIKDLKKVRKQGFDQRRMLIVDDTPRNSIRNYGNAIYIKPFEGEEDDDELLLLAEYLEGLASEPNFRTIEKRFWRQEVESKVAT